MATKPYFVWPTQQQQQGSSSTAVPDITAFGFGDATEDQQAGATAEKMAPLVSPGSFSGSNVARPRLRRSGSTGRQVQQQAAGGAGAPKKPPQRGLGVAELERLRCGGDPLRDLGVDGAMGVDAASVHGNSVLLQHQHHHLPPMFNAPIGAPRFYSPFLVQPPPAPPAPFCYVHSHSAGGQSVAPEHQFIDRWGRMGSFGSAGGGAGSVHQHHLPAPAAEHPSSQSTVWRPVSSSSCLHTGQRCDFCSNTLRAITERGSRAPATAAIAATTNLPDYHIYDLPAAMAAARKGTAGEKFLARDEGKKDVKEIEFFPTSTNHNGAVVRPDESEFATISWTPFSSSSSAGDCTAPLDLSLKL